MVPSELPSFKEGWEIDFHVALFGMVGNIQSSGTGTSSELQGLRLKQDIANGGMNQRGPHL